MHISASSMAELTEDELKSAAIQVLSAPTEALKGGTIEKNTSFSRNCPKMFLLVFTSSMIYFSSSISFLSAFNWYREKNCNFLNTVAWLSW